MLTRRRGGRGGRRTPVACFAWFAVFLSVAPAAPELEIGSGDSHSGPVLRSCLDDLPRLVIGSGGRSGHGQCALRSSVDIGMA